MLTFSTYKNDGKKFNTLEEKYWVTPTSRIKKGSYGATEKGLFPYI